MIKSTIRARTYRAIYRLLNRVSPVPFDCGTICGAACCPGSPDYDPEEHDMGLYMLPGEDKVHDKKDGWLEWSTLDTDEYDFPESWKGSVYFVTCRGPEKCNREIRPIQCRTFPLEPVLLNQDSERLEPTDARAGCEEGEITSNSRIVYKEENSDLALIYNEMDLPYCCPLIEEGAELDPRFLKATYTVWKHLIEDPLIYDMVASKDGSVGK